METVTVYKDSWENLQEREFQLATELAELKGKLAALANETTPSEYALAQLKEIVKNFK